MTDQMELPSAIWARPAFPVNSKEEMLRIYETPGSIDATEAVRWLSNNNLAGFGDSIDCLVNRCSSHKKELEIIQ